MNYFGSNFSLFLFLHFYFYAKAYISFSLKHSSFKFRKSSFFLSVYEYLPCICSVILIGVELLRKFHFLNRMRCYFSISFFSELFRKLLKANKSRNSGSMKMSKQLRLNFSCFFNFTGISLILM